MSTLNTLKLVVAKRPTQLSPTQHRRNKLSKKIGEQIFLAQALAEGKTYQPTRYKTVRDADTGISRSIEVPKRIKQWWWVQDNGKVCLSVRYGTKQLELGKGKTACEVASGDELINALSVIKSAVEQGELDTEIEKVSGSLRANFG